MSNHRNGGKDFLLGAVVGGILGAVSALLLAPKSGRELRSDLSEKSQAAVSKAKETIESIAADVKEWRESRKLVGPNDAELESEEERTTN